MASTSPWSVKGVDPEAREAAKIAARKAGMTVGQWLNQIIRVAASEQLRNGGRNAPPPPPPPHYQQPEPQPQQAAYDAPPPGYEPQQAPQGPGGYNAPAPTMQAIFESIQKLSTRIEAAEMKTTAAIAPLAEQVDHLSHQIDEVKSQTGVSTAPLERAMMRLSERLQKVEETRTAPKRSGGGLFGLFKERG
jgi:localization factor PodJL